MSPAKAGSIEPTWTEARREHRPLFPTFTCTTPRPRADSGRTLAHPKPWEWEVQAHIRQLKTPVHNDVVQLGLMGQELVSVAQFVIDDSASVPVVFVRVIGVTLRARGEGGGIADATLEQVVNRSAKRLRMLGHSRFVLLGNVHTDNTASQSMLTRAGFTATERREGPYVRWVLLAEY